jgi:hypothetical protein
MEKVANSWWMYLLGVIVVIFVLAGSLFFILKSFKDAKKLNMDSKVLKQTIINSAVFTILPSISILIGVITLSGVLGIPLPWIRLTVIGALHYEGVAANSAYEGIKSLSELTSVQFVTIAFVMTLGILSGPLYCLFGFKSYDKKILSKAKGDNEVVVKEESLVEENKKPKKNFGDVLFNAVFIAMICSFLAVDVAKVFDKEQGAIKNYVPIVVIITTFLSMFVLDMLQKKLKWKWLASFDLGLSMLIGMTVAVLVG